MTNKKLLAAIAILGGSMGALAQPESGIYRGTLSCGASLLTPSSSGWSDKVQIEVRGSQLTWTRTGVDTTSGGSSPYRESGTSNIQPSGKTFLEAEGRFLPNSSRTGAWFTRGELTLEDGRIVGTNLTQITPDRIRTLRNCTTTSSVQARVAVIQATTASQNPLKASSEPIPVFANRRALVIGNDSYQSVGKLVNAREDAKAIASGLIKVGYQVTLKLDLSEKEMKSALRTFKEQIQGGDEVLFFYAGHGVQLGGSNYLLPVDILGQSEEQVKDEAIQLQRVLDDMTERKAKFSLAMIDACRDNPFKTSGRSLGGRGMSPTTAATGQMVIFSAGAGQQALDRLGPKDTNKNGLFTRVFLEEMQKPGVSIDRVVRNVRNDVVGLAKSVGHEQVPAIYDQVIGEFYFKR